MSAEPVDETEEHEWRSIDMKDKRTRRRLHRLRRATGVPSHSGYPVFRRVIMMIAGFFTRVEVIHPENIPGGLTYYEDISERNDSSESAEYGFVIAPTHRTVWDIVAVGQIERGMTWVCKAPFAMLFWAHLCQNMGAVPVFRYGKDDSPKVSRFMQWCFRRWTFHDLDEYGDQVMSNLRRGIPAVVFPQATRRADEKAAQAAKNGAAMFAREAGVPLIPAAVVGGSGKHDKPERFVHYRTGKVFDRAPTRLDRLRYRRFVLLVIGEPIFLQGIAAKVATFGGTSSDAHAMKLWEQAVQDLDLQGEDILESM